MLTKFLQCNCLRKVHHLTLWQRDYKTGRGKADGIVADAWFTGFAESTTGKIYFCVRLGRSDGMNVSSSLAKEIAIRIVSDYFA